MKEMEKIDHPAHYNLNGRKECIEEMLDLYGPEKVAAFVSSMPTNTGIATNGKAERSIWRRQDGTNTTWRC